MDDVLSYSLILNEGDTLFKKDDIPFEMMMPKSKKFDQETAII